MRQVAHWAKWFTNATEAAESKAVKTHNQAVENLVATGFTPPEVEIGRSRNWLKSKLAEVEIGRSRTMVFALFLLSLFLVFSFTLFFYFCTFFLFLLISTSFCFLFCFCFRPKNLN